jgi:pyruvate dehydrogenase (quinone)
MNGRRRLIGSFNHGSMADALPLAIGIQASSPGRQVVSLSGDGGLAMLMGELLTLRQQHLPVKVVVLNNGALAFVELEMMADGYVNFGTDLDNPSFAEIARAVGLHGVRIERLSDLEGGLCDGLTHDGASIIEVMTVRQELSIPPKISYDQARGFTLWATRSIFSGHGDEVIEVAKTNLRELALE